MSKIKLLNDDIINQIAAGEIVERPGSALKELIENSIDAFASNIDIFLKNGGKSKIVIEDDGEGLSKEDLAMCIKRHATSKLNDINLFNIKSFGFRGEAIPSIASVSKFSIESKGFGISVNFSMPSEIFPSQIQGTKITVEDLFSSTPVRLKFLKSDSSELLNCVNIIENFALTVPSVNFSLNTDEKQILQFKNDSVEERIAQIFGPELFKKAIYFEESNDKLKARGYLFHPSDNRYSQSFQKIFVNNRFVKDKTISASIKNAYRDLLPSGRYAIAIIMVDIDPFYVDVNISPTKSEIRFRDPLSTQKFITESILKHLKKFDRIFINFNATPFLEKVKNNSSNIDSKLSDFFETKTLDLKEKKPFDLEHNFFQSPEKDNVEENNNPKISQAPFEESVSLKSNEEKTSEDHFFGRALTQVFDSYIIAQKENEIIIIDQHAVHEKITQTKLLSQINSKNKQFLLKPEIIELNEKQIGNIEKNIENLTNCGFRIELMKSSILVTAVPAVLQDTETKNFIIDMLETEFPEEFSVLDLIKKKIADTACHNSIRFGRKLSVEEMNEIINQMEQTYSIHQCNHHRPSFISISKHQLEKMFDR